MRMQYFGSLEVFLKFKYVSVYIVTDFFFHICHIGIFGITLGEEGRLPKNQ